MRAFQELMDSGAPLRFWGAFGIATAFSPLLVLLHELGHATVGLTLTEGLVQVRVGREPAWLQGRVGRLAFSLSGRFDPGSRAGTARTLAWMRPGQELAYVLAGPVANLALAAALTPVVRAAHGVPRVVAACLLGRSLLLGVGNLVPRGGSDGQRALAALRRLARGERPSPLDQAFAAVHARWLVLLTRPPEGERRRRLALGIASFADPSTPEEAIALVQMAAAGWYWRAAEACGTASDDAPLSSVAAAVAVVEREVELGYGSPGRTPDERVALLRRLLDSLAPALGKGRLPPEDARRAFRLGVALHDQERIG